MDYLGFFPVAGCGMLLPVGELLPRGAYENRVYVPLSRFGSSETELLVLHAIFRCDRTFRAFAAVIN